MVANIIANASTGAPIGNAINQIGNRLQQNRLMNQRQANIDRARQDNMNLLALERQDRAQAQRREQEQAFAKAEDAFNTATLAGAYSASDEGLVAFLQRSRQEAMQKGFDTSDHDGLLGMIAEGNTAGARELINAQANAAAMQGRIELPQATQGGFTLKPGENRFDASGQLVASGGAVTPKPVDPVEAQLQQIRLQEAEAAQQARIAEQEQAAIDTKNQKRSAVSEAQTGIDAIDQLLDGGLFKSIYGFSGIALPTTKANARAYRDQIAGLLALENRQKLKGQGTITDTEQRTLERAATLLANEDISERVAAQELKRVRKVFEDARARSYTLPEGVDWDDINTTASANNMSIAEVLDRLEAENGGS